MKGIHTVSTTETTYNVSESEGKVKNVRTAQIIFRDGIFHKCEYNLTCTQYCIEDWEFLGVIAGKIDMLQDEYDKGKR